MTFLVKDFSPEKQRWVSWTTDLISNAYSDYPYTGNSFPSVSQLSGKLVVVKELTNSSGSSGNSIASSIWVKVGEDLTPFEIVDGHTGAWSIREADNLVISNQVFLQRIDNNSISLSPTSSPDQIVFIVEEDGSIIFTNHNTSEYGNALLLTLGNEEISVVPYEYAITSGLAETVINTNEIINPIDIVPGSTNMQDKFWAQIKTEITSTDIVLK